MRRLRGNRIAMVYQDPGDVPESDHAGGPADRGSAAGAPRFRCTGGPADPAPYCRIVGERATAGPGSDGHALPPSIERRPAAAGSHRHGARLRAGSADHGRTDDGAGRHHGGDHPGTRAELEEANQRRYRLCEPQPRSGRRGCRPRRGDVCRPDGGRGSGAGALQEAPKHPYTAGLLRCVLKPPGEAGPTRPAQQHSRQPSFP